VFSDNTLMHCRMMKKWRRLRK